MVTVLVTSYPIAGHAKLFGESDSLMTACASVGADRSSCDTVLNRVLDVVNTMAVSAYRRTRNSTDHRLTVDALHEISAFLPVTLAACTGDVDLCNRRL